MGLYGNKFILLDEHLLFITEAYFGKLPFLLEVEKSVHELRKPENLNRFKDLDSSAPVQRINRLMEQGFGMEIFSLQIERSDYINAYTVPVATRYDVALNMNMQDLVEVSQSSGYRFKPNNHLCIICVMSIGLLKIKEITDGEIVATMLHEIGHNFAEALYKDIRTDTEETAKYLYRYYFQLVIRLVFEEHEFKDAILLLLHKNKVVNTSKHIGDKANKLKKFNPLRGLAKSLGSKIIDIKDFSKAVFKRYFKYTSLANQFKLAEIYDVKKQFRKSLDRQNEVIADKFVGIYGYGPEQGSGLLKMDNQPSKAAQFVNKLPGGKAKNKRYDALLIKANDIDEHPHVIQRINAEINVLKYELKKGCDPKYEAMIKQQIAQLEKLINDATTIMKRFNQDQKAQALYNAYINQQEPDALDAEIEDRINDALDALLSGGES